MEKKNQNVALVKAQEPIKVFDLQELKISTTNNVAIVKVEDLLAINLSNDTINESLELCEKNIGYLVGITATTIDEKTKALKVSEYTCQMFNAKSYEPKTTQEQREEYVNKFNVVYDRFIETKDVKKYGCRKSYVKFSSKCIKSSVSLYYKPTDNGYVQITKEEYVALVGEKKIKDNTPKDYIFTKCTDSIKAIRLKRVAD